MDQLQVLGFDIHADHGVAVFEFNRGDLANLDTGDHHRLPLTRSYRLRTAEVGREMGEVLPDQRRPRGQRRFLLGENPQRHYDRNDREDGDCDRIFASTPRLARQRGAEVLPAASLGGLLTHGLTTVKLGAPTWPSGPLTSGTGWVEQRTLGFLGGRPPSCGCTPSGGTAVWAQSCLSVLRLPEGFSCLTSTSPPPGCTRR